jgi:Protein of unknown function (DUF998)
MTTRRLALAGLLGPPVFAAIVVVVTAIEWDFLHRIGWTAGLFDDPEPPWPSSTALGRYGFLQILNFIVLGVAVLALAVALFRLLNVRRKIGASLLLVLGVALLGSAFRTDYGSVGGGGPETWNGTVHAAAFTVLVPAAFASMLALAVQFRRDERWRSLSRYSVAAAIVALGSIVAYLAGGGNLFFYIFLAVVLGWLDLVSARAFSLARSTQEFRSPLEDR